MTWEWKHLRVAKLSTSSLPAVRSRRMTVGQSRGNWSGIRRVIWTKKKSKWSSRTHFRKFKIWLDCQRRRHQPNIWFPFQHHIDDKNPAAKMILRKCLCRRLRAQKIWMVFCRQRSGDHWIASRVKGTLWPYSARPVSQNHHQVRQKF